MRKVILLSLILFAVGVGFYWASPLTTYSSSIKNEMSDLSSASAKVNKENLSQIPELHQRLKKAGLQLSQLHEDPTQIEIQLRDWAQFLSSGDLVELAKISQDYKHDQDQRFLAVTLLSWSQQAVAGPLLTQIAGSSFDSLLSPGRLGDFEKIIRLRAAEGIGELSLPSLEKQVLVQQVLAKTPYSEVADRMHRVQWNLVGSAPTPEEQDQEALQKLLSKEE